MSEQDERLVNYKILIRAPRNLLKPGEEGVAFYEVNPRQWTEIPEPQTGVLEQLASVGAHTANIPMGRFLGGACMFVNMQLLVEPELEVIEDDTDDE